MRTLPPGKAVREPWIVRDMSGRRIRSISPNCAMPSARATMPNGDIPTCGSMPTACLRNTGSPGTTPGATGSMPSCAAPTTTGDALRPSLRLPFRCGCPMERMSGSWRWPTTSSTRTTWIFSGSVGRASCRDSRNSNSPPEAIPSLSRSAARRRGSRPSITMGRFGRRAPTTGFARVADHAFHRVYL